ncbi:ATP-binding protein [Corynebacterium hindlerae]|uniref:ATP-binding protein n=1 Tax=Corynebacterium hindlerae TaxID=699041 RepID=A0A7G5FC34_9CORY|nr:ATP-binding protein [Corynebacterium hindlerae]QMV84175.1 ATP-binding protein [Corynebacterium hindlerae]
MSELSARQDFDLFIEAAPLPSIQHALGSNHDVYSGLDELIDNSIDAGASKIAIVFHLVEGLVDEVHIHDDGHGMSQETLENILRLGAHNPQKSNGIGRYGVGLKEASLSNSTQTSVISAEEHAQPVGRTMFSGSFQVGVLSAPQVDRLWAERRKAIGGGSGTTVIWHNLIDSYQGSDPDQARAYLSLLTVKISQHIGLRYHRFLADQPELVSLYVQQGPTATPFKTGRVQPINPFGYPRPGAPGYPKKLTVGGEENAPGITVHLWPESKSVNFVLDRAGNYSHQGFYLYLNGRLITEGDWLNLIKPARNLRLARVEIDDPRVIDEYFTISPQKGAVRTRNSFHEFVESLRDPANRSFGFEEFIDYAVEIAQENNKRDSKLKPIVPPGKGMAEPVVEVIEETAAFAPRDPINVVWTSRISDEGFANIDFRSNTIRLNEALRPALGLTGSEAEDAPLLRTLAYLLFNEFFDMARKSQRAMDKLALYQAALDAAVAEEIEAHERRLLTPKRKSTSPAYPELQWKLGKNKAEQCSSAPADRLEVESVDEPGTPRRRRYRTDDSRSWAEIFADFLD